MMRCVACGERIDSYHQHCPSCGMPLPPARRVRPVTRQGIPIVHYQPAPFGPPIVSDPPPPIIRSHPNPTGRTWPQSASGSRTSSAFIPAVRRTRLAAMLGIIVLLTLLAWRVGAPRALRLPFFVTQAPTQGPACDAPSIQSAAAQALRDVALASSLRDAAHQDYRPATTTTSFHAGQSAYLTFQIASNNAGNATVLFCAPGATVRGQLMVPESAAGRYAQFSAIFSRANAGRGVAILRWNGQVAAAMPFTIVTPQPR